MKRDRINFEFNLKGKIKPMKEEKLEIYITEESDVCASDNILKLKNNLINNDVSTLRKVDILKRIDKEVNIMKKELENKLDLNFDKYENIILIDRENEYSHLAENSAIKIYNGSDDEIRSDLKRDSPNFNQDKIENIFKKI